MIQAPAYQKWGGNLAGWLAAGAILASFALSVTVDAFYRYGKGTFWGYANGYIVINRLLDSASDGHGLFLHFTHFDYPDSQTFAGSVYTQAHYHLYPQPVLATQPGVIVNTPLQMLGANFDPDAPWMWQHHVERELSIESTDRYGGISFTIVSAQPGK